MRSGEAVKKYALIAKSVPEKNGNINCVCMQ